MSEHSYMIGVKSVAAEVLSFFNWLLRERAPAMAQVEQLANGFEGWLKIEFLLWLTTTRTPSLRKNDAGVEYKFSLDTRDARKQCDIWVRSGRRELYHYVELKVPLCNANRNKVLDSAALDYVLLTQMRTVYEQGVSANEIIVGARFDDHSWNCALERVRLAAGIAPDTCIEVGGPVEPRGLIRWHVFTRNLGG